MKKMAALLLAAALLACLLALSAVGFVLLNKRRLHG